MKHVLGWMVRRLQVSRDATRRASGWVSFRCNICGSACRSQLSALQREQPSCGSCDSTVRYRSIIHVLTVKILGRSLAITDLPVRKDIRGLGFSDWEGYAGLLSQRFDYINTYYDSDPKLDITAVPADLEGRYDFVIASDVFEHVAPPIGRAFVNARRLLKPGGVLVFSVPYTLEGETLEHFPELHEFEIEKDGAIYTLRNITVDGREQVFRNLIFHGGSGLTLEMRRFAKASLLREFRLAGFEPVEVYGAPDFSHGVYWAHQWSLPIAARPAR